MGRIGPLSSIQMIRNITHDMAEKRFELDNSDAVRKFVGKMGETSNRERACAAQFEGVEREEKVTLTHSSTSSDDDNNNVKLNHL